MGVAIEILRTGSWLTRERVRLIALAVLVASGAGLAYLVLTAHGVIDTQGRPLGTDFSNVYAAGTYALDGQPQAPFDPALQHARERALFGQATPFYGWHYPPPFLLLAAVLALMPYGIALAVWQGVTLALYLLSIGAILRTTATTTAIARDPLWLLLALAFPAVLVNLGHGHNGFLTAALMGGALVLLERRPILAGVLFGLLVYKPQFGLMIPLALIAGGRWRTFAAAGTTVVAVLLVSTLAFGTQIWDAFLASTHYTRVVVLEAGDTGWHKIQSVFAWARMWGASVGLAYAMQAITAVAVGVAVVWLWRSKARFALKAAALAIAAVLTTPYSLDYDMMVLAPAIAFFSAYGFERGFAPWEKSTLAALWLVPLLARAVADWTMVPLGVPAMAAAFLLVLQRAAADASPGTSEFGANSTMAAGSTFPWFASGE
jgi:hypothetical protein